jgi:hypothetical protein
MSAAATWSCQRRWREPGREKVTCARARCVAPPSKAFVFPAVVVVTCGQVARPDGRRVGPSERGASDRSRSFRPFLRRRLDDRMCACATSSAYAHLHSAPSLTYTLLQIYTPECRRAVRTPPSWHHLRTTFTGKFLRKYYSFFMSFDIIAFLLCVNFFFFFRNILNKL